MHYFNLLLQLSSSDSGVSSASSSGLSTPLMKRKSRTSHKKAYCMICNVFIYKEGKRSQGPRRHVLQHHVRRPLYQCPHCSHSSFYDKHHVTSHMRRLHRDTSNSLVNRTSEFEEEIKKWYHVWLNNFISKLLSGSSQNSIYNFGYNHAIQLYSSQ
uniref:C2H2-type domain-containing protein n=1 Tax=Heterorhabditis bacteriophora TaxID=37862 RepID=A0A1I7XK61_HETBA